MFVFLQGEDKSIERGENHYTLRHVESFSYADGEIVGLVQSTPVAGSVTSHSRRVVFLIVFSLQRLTEQLHNKRSNDWHEILISLVYKS